VLGYTVLVNFDLWWQNFISGFIGALFGGLFAGIGGWYGARYAFQTHLKRLRRNSETLRG
jgi:hypothetical protein